MSIITCIGSSPAAEAFTAMTFDEPGGRSVLISGELDFASRCILFDACLEGRTRPRVTIDMGGLTFMDCAGYASLRFAQRHLADVGRNATTANAAGQPAWLLELIEALPMAGPRRVEITSWPQELSDAS